MVGCKTGEEATLGVADEEEAIGAGEEDLAANAKRDVCRRSFGFAMRDVVAVSTLDLLVVEARD